MRIFEFKKCKCDKNYLFWLILAVIASIICGIVLFKISKYNIYFYNFASEYVYNVFCFNNGALFFPHFLAEIFYLYAFFCIARFTKFKYLTLILVVIRSVFASVYCAVLFTMCGIGGVTVCLIIYIPSFLISIAACYFVADFYCCVDKRYVFIFPFALAVLSSILNLLLINLLFRIIIVLV